MPALVAAQVEAVFALCEQWDAWQLHHAAAAAVAEGGRLSSQTLANALTIAAAEIPAVAQPRFWSLLRAALGAAPLVGAGTVLSVHLLLTGWLCHDWVVVCVFTPHHMQDSQKDWALKCVFCRRLVKADTQPQLEAGIAGRSAALLHMLLDDAAAAGVQAAETVSGSAAAGSGSLQHAASTASKQRQRRWVPLSALFPTHSARVSDPAGPTVPCRCHSGRLVRAERC